MWRRQWTLNRGIIQKPNAILAKGSTMSVDSRALTGWERVAVAIEKVRERLLRSTAALEKAGIPYAVLGGNAVAEWVGRVDQAAVRFTRDVDILLRREDFPAAIDAMKAAGFEHHRTMDVEMFLDGPDASPRDAVHIIFADEKVRDRYAAAAPNVNDSERTADFNVLSLEALVRMKLTSYRRKDQVHVLDMLSVGLIDVSWCDRLQRELATRLQALIDDPDG